jgi:hypothetical protein
MALSAAIPISGLCLYLLAWRVSMMGYGASVLLAAGQFAGA